MERLVSRRIIWVLGLGLIFAVGCHRLGPGKPAGEFTAQEAAGQRVFESACARCHYAHSEKGLNGPGLQGVFRKPYLSSGSPANNDRVTAVLLHGRNMMPAFGNTLSEKELDDLLAYLHTL